MNWLVYHIVSGESFFTGVALVLLAVWLSSREHRLAKRFWGLVLIVGLIAVLVSSTPMSLICCGLLAGATVWWLIANHRDKFAPHTRVIVVVAWLFAVGLEAPFHISPKLTPVDDRAVVIIGDSLTVGTGEDATWPKLLASEHGLTVQDISHVGETSASALKRAEGEQIDAPIVVVEIGGNDLLGGTSSAQFHDDLDALLTFLAAPDRQLVMFELPLPLFYHGYGRVQRVLARKHNARLIPKRVLLGVLATDGATLDTIHLSSAGHQRMADDTWTVLASALEQ